MAEVNPFRYRGYYYDTESGFYYLQTRYYDPTIRQFINADNYELLPTLSQSIGELNLYQYCGNNPIMNIDPTGEAWLLAYCIALLGSIWDMDIRNDMKNIKWNPFNSDAEQAAKLNKVSFYKGSAVVKQSFLGGTGAGFGTIWVESGEPINATDIKHEWGHNVQEILLGVLYWPLVALPSAIYCKTGDYLEYGEPLSSKMYYSKVWERTADWLGGVDRANYFNFWNINNFIFW